jgi:hypothetical protein
MASRDRDIPETADYVHQLAEACQRFAGSTAIIEPAAFSDAIGRLMAETELVETHAELFMGWASVSNVAVRGALEYHRGFHRYFGGTCAFEPPALSLLGAVSSDALRARITEWAAACERTFAAEHRWPPAVAATALLRRNPLAVCYTPQLAKAVGASCSTLERSCRTVYGCSLQHYHALLRVRNTLQRVRSDPGCLEGVALDAGWSSMSDLGRVLRELTGMRLSAVRLLTPAAFTLLLSGVLALPVPGPKPVTFAPGRSRQLRPRAGRTSRVVRHRPR